MICSLLYLYCACHNWMHILSESEQDPLSLFWAFNTSLAFLLEEKSKIDKRFFFEPESYRSANSIQIFCSNDFYIIINYSKNGTS